MDRLLCIEKAQDRAILPHQQIPIIKIGSSLSVKRFHTELKSLLGSILISLHLNSKFTGYLCKRQP